MPAICREFPLVRRLLNKTAFCSGRESERKPSGSRWPWERWYTEPDGLLKRVKPFGSPGYLERWPGVRKAFFVSFHSSIPSRYVLSWNGRAAHNLQRRHNGSLDLDHRERTCRSRTFWHCFFSCRTPAQPP